VIRTDTPQAFREAVQWVQGIQVKADRDAAQLGLVVESFIPAVNTHWKACCKKAGCACLRYSTNPIRSTAPISKKRFTSRHRAYLKKAG